MSPITNHLYAACDGDNAVMKWTNDDSIGVLLSGTCIGAVRLTISSTTGDVFVVCPNSNIVLAWIGGSGSPITLPGTCPSVCDVAVSTITTTIVAVCCSETGATSVMAWTDGVASISAITLPSAPNYPTAVTIATDTDMIYVLKDSSATLYRWSNTSVSATWFCICCSNTNC